MLDTNPITNRARKARRACERSRSARARAESAEVLSLAVVSSRGAEVVLAVGRGLDVCVEEESCACTVAAAASKASEASASETRLAPSDRIEIRFGGDVYRDIIMQALEDRRVLDLSYAGGAPFAVQPHAILRKPDGT